MRSSSSIVAALTMVMTQACAWTSDGGLTARYESKDERTVESAAGSWDGAPLSIVNAHGSIQVVGVARKTRISAHARFVAGANSQADADAAFADVGNAITIEKRGAKWVVDCPRAKAWHGSVDPESTGCTSIRVEVPAGTKSAPLELTGVTAFGGIHVSGLTVKKLDLQAPFGLVADVRPTGEAELRLFGEPLVTGLCSSILRVPAETTIGSASLSVTNASIRYAGVSPEDPTYWLGTYVEGFPDAPRVAPRSESYEWSRGVAPFAAKSVEVHASLGKAVLTTAAVPAYQPFNECLETKLEVVSVSSD